MGGSAGALITTPMEEDIMLCTASDALIGYVTAPSTRLSFDPVRSAVRIELALALRQFDKQRSLLNLNRVRRARLHWLALNPNGEAER